MDYKKNNKRNQPNSSGTSHFTESNAGHISVKTTSPFLNRMKESEFTVTEQNHSKSKKNLSTSVLNKKIPHDVGSGTSKLLISQILRDSNIEKDAIPNLSKCYGENNLHQIEKCNYDQNFLISNVKFDCPTPTLNSKSFSLQHGSCSGEESIARSKTSSEDQNTRNCSEIYDTACFETTVKDKHFAEKTTYCRPASYKNLEFINKTVERNNRLQRLVKKLIDVRKKEKDTEAWNNYINDLKNKHGYGDTEENGPIDQYTLEESRPFEYIDDYYNIPFLSTRSHQCRDLLSEFYEACNRFSPNDSYRCQIDNKNQKPQCYKSYYYKNQNCYPMSSQAGLMLNKKKHRRDSPGYSYRRNYNESNYMETLPYSRPFHGNTIYVEREPIRLRPSSSRGPNRKCENISLSGNNTNQSHQLRLVNTSVQTEDLPTTSSNKGCSKLLMKEVGTQEEDAKDTYTRLTENVERLKKKIQETCNIDAETLQQNILQSIEGKLDTLLTSMRSFMEEAKAKTYGRSYDCQSVCIKPLNINNVSHRDIPTCDSIALTQAERLVCGLTQNQPKTSNLSSQSNICEKLLIQDLDSNAKVKGDIESMLGERVVSCSVQISIDVPTIERSTEVTDSLSRTVFQLEDKAVSIEEIERKSTSRDANMTIAVNTDPLGVLALLRISAEAVKQLLSYVPNIPYHHYLPLINFPQRTETDVYQYVCNICGAAFVRPSQLSDHIRSHDLGKTRDCCVCRHVLDGQRHRPPGLFRCQHCGQRFTRAYCCELHQRSCARRLGIRLENNSSLILLR